MKRLILAILVCFSALSLAQVTVTPIVQPHVFFVDKVGNPCAACNLYSYIAGTTTPQPTYIDSTGIPTNTNPIILDASGGAQIWLGNNSYKFVLKTSAGVTIWTVDNVSGGGFQFTVFEHNGVPLPNQKILNFLDATPGLPASGTADIFLNDSNGGLGSFTPNATSSSTGTVQPDNTTTFVNSGIISANASGGFGTLITPPIAGQYVVIYPTAGVESSHCSSSTYTVGASSGTMRYVYGGSGSCTEALTWNGFALPSYVLAANVTSVYGFAITSVSPEVTSNQGGPTTTCSSCSSNLVPAGINYAWPKQQFTAATTYTGTTLSAATMTAGFVGSVIGAKTTNMDISSLGLIVYYTGTAPPVNTNVLVQPPLFFNPADQTLGLSLPVDLGLDTGAANAYAVTINGLGLTPGATAKFVPTHASTTTAPTFNLNGYGAITILGPQGGALVSGDMTTTATAALLFSNGKWYLQNPQASLTVGAGAGMTGNQGTGLLVQHSTGSTTTNDCVKFDANGNTIDSGAACQIGTGKTCNANGCYTIAGDGTITEWGYSTAAASGSAATLTITFPSAFNSTTHLVIVADGYGTPSGDGNPHPLACHIVDSTVTTSGASVIVALPTQVGGSGYSALNSTVKCSWHALGD